MTPRLFLFRRRCIAVVFFLMTTSAQATDFVYPAARHSLDALTPVVMPYPLGGNEHTGTTGNNSTTGNDSSAGKSGDRLKRWQASLTHVNQFSGGVAGNEELLLDGERSVLSLNTLVALSACWDMSVNVPLIAHADGYFDRSIESWHRFFNLPNGDRADVAPDQLDVAYTDGIAAPLRLSNASASLGDVSLQAYYHCAGGWPTAQWVPSFGIKLSTGDESELTGNGATDLLAGLTSAPFQWSDKLTGRAALGLALAGDSSLFAQESRQIVSGSLVLGYRWSAQHEWLAQLDVNSASFDSELLELGDTTAQLTVAWRRYLAKQRWFEIGIVEDLIADTAPDIALYLSWINQTAH